MLIDDMSTEENIMLPLVPVGISLSESRDRCHRAMASLGIAHLANQRVILCSGGKRQRIATARAVVSHPVILIADTVVVASHDPRLDARLSPAMTIRLAGGRPEFPA